MSIVNGPTGQSTNPQIFRPSISTRAFSRRINRVCSDLGVDTRNCIKNLVKTGAVYWVESRIEQPDIDVVVKRVLGQFRVIEVLKGPCAIQEREVALIKSLYDTKLFELSKEDERVVNPYYVIPHLINLSDTDPAFQKSINKIRGAISPIIWGKLTFGEETQIKGDQVPLGFRFSPIFNTDDLDSISNSGNTFRDCDLAEDETTQAAAYLACIDYLASWDSDKRYLFTLRKVTQ